jgi:PleD family two-component response regulator
MAGMAVAVVSPTPRSCMSWSARDVLALADAVLYGAKEGGRDTYFLEAG